jgi:hypothetical protein
MAASCHRNSTEQNFARHLAGVDGIVAEISGNAEHIAIA